jgi:hypothetical protein
VKINLFDKYVNLHFYSEGDTSARSIFTPDSGRKPSIRISGKWVTSVDIQSMEIRVANLLVDRPLSQFGSLNRPGYMSLEAGYRGGLDTTIKGKIQNSYQEIPGPDGITVFQMLMGRFTEWVTATIAANWLKGTRLSDVLGELCSQLNVGLRYSQTLSQSITLPHNLDFTGAAKDLLYVLQQMFLSYDPTTGALTGLKLMPVGHDLIACPFDKGTGTVHQLDFVSHAKHLASGFDIQAPWVPAVRPMDQVRINPRYFRQDLGGSLVQPGNVFTVYMVQFEFATDDDTNMMTLMTAGSQESV